MKKSMFMVILFCLTEIYCSLIWANAEFTASQACPAYSSFKRQTNPENISLVVGESYPFITVNKPDDPQWYRLRVASANPPERWVQADCGKLNGDIPNGGGHNKQACGISGQADSFVLALSWQPAFCETKPQKPECAITDPLAYQASHFTLHGLWPNKASCGTHYEFCGDVKNKQNNFCDYPEIPLVPGVREKLAQVMPSVGSDSCLERHEWHKHGTCQSLGADQYYAQAVDLARQFNDSGVAAFVAGHIGESIELQTFLKVLDERIGQGASEHAKLICNNGLLQDIYLSLPAVLPADAALTSLLDAAPKAPRDNSCKNGFKVDRIGQ